MLAMANYNRIADGLEATAEYRVTFVAEANPEVTNGYFASLRFIYDQLRRPNWESREALSGKDGLIGVQIIIERSKLFGGMLLPGTFDMYRIMCK
jgi:hypothetical protein